MKKNNRYSLLMLLFVLLFYKPAETNIAEYFADKNFSWLLHTSEKERPSHKKEMLLSASALQELSNKIHEYYENLFRHKSFNGCVLVAIGDKIIYQNAFGYSDIRQKTCLHIHSLFQLASVSKIFTATAVLKLYEQKQIDLYAPVQKYIPEFPYPNITIHHLLTHTSGLVNYLHTMQNIGRQDTVLSHQSVLQYLVHKKPRTEFRAGKRYKYCNTNYAILACLIERASGMSYSDFLKKEIFIPLDMKHTNTIYYVDVFDESTTSSHEYKSRSVPFYAGDFILGDKSIYSDIQDLFKFSQHFMNKKILHDTIMQKMFKGVKTNRYGILYGYGIRIRDYEDSAKMVVFHNGWWHGYRTSFQMRPKDKITLIVLSNHIHKTTYYTYPVFQTIDEVLYKNNKTSKDSIFKSSYPGLDEE